MVLPVVNYKPVKVLRDKVLELTQEWFRVDPIAKNTNLNWLPDQNKSNIRIQDVQPDSIRKLPHILVMMGTGSIKGVDLRHYMYAEDTETKRIRHYGGKIPLTFSFICASLDKIQLDTMVGILGMGLFVLSTNEMLKVGIQVLPQGISFSGEQTVKIDSSTDAYRNIVTVSTTSDIHYTVEEEMPNTEIEVDANGNTFVV